MHADRANRVVLTVIGVLALALGVGGLLAAAGVFGNRFQQAHLVDNGLSRYFGAHGDWLWPAVAAVVLVIVLLALLWLLRLLFATDRSSSIAIASPSSGSQSPYGGRTTMASSALIAAVSGEIAGYRGVTTTKARVLGELDKPTLALNVTVTGQTDLTALIERIEREAISHARQALERDDLPVQLDISVNDKAVSRTQ